MAAPSVHDASGKTCRCGKVFERHSFNITITTGKDRGCLIKEKVCGSCFHDHHSKGE